MSEGPSFEELLRHVRGGDEEAAARLVRDFEPVVRRVLRARLRDARARREFDSMSEEERQMVELRGQGLSWEEVAASLGGTAGARRNQLARALDRVARELHLDED